MRVVERVLCRGGQNKCKYARGQGLKGLLMMALVGGNMGRKTFLGPNIPGINNIYNYYAWIELNLII